MEKEKLTEQEKKSTLALLIMCNNLATAPFEKVLRMNADDPDIQLEIARIAKILIKHYADQFNSAVPGQEVEMKPGADEAKDKLNSFFESVRLSSPNRVLRAITRRVEPLLENYLLRYKIH